MKDPEREAYEKALARYQEVVKVLCDAQEAFDIARDAVQVAKAELNRTSTVMWTAVIERKLNEGR